MDRQQVGQVQSELQVPVIGDDGQVLHGQVDTVVVEGGLQHQPILTAYLASNN